MNVTGYMLSDSYGPEVKSSTDPQDAKHGPHNESRVERSEITGVTNLHMVLK